MYTRLSASDQSSSRSPPGRWARSLRPVRPVSTPATQTAHAPVPQASVMPLPRSHVRIVTSLGECTFTKWTLTRRGNAACVFDLRAELGDEVAIVGRSTRRRRRATACGLPIDTHVASNVRPADRERRVHRRVARQRRRDVGRLQDRLAHVHA